MPPLTSRRPSDVAARVFGDECRLRCGRTWTERSFSGSASPAGAHAGGRERKEPSFHTSAVRDSGFTRAGAEGTVVPHVDRPGLGVHAGGRERKEPSFHTSTVRDSGFTRAGGSGRNRHSTRRPSGAWGLTRAGGSGRNRRSTRRPSGTQGSRERERKEPSFHTSATPPRRGRDGDARTAAPPIEMAGDREQRPGPLHLFPAP